MLLIRLVHCPDCHRQTIVRQFDCLLDCNNKANCVCSRYKIGSDPAGWLTVDPHTGDITTVNTPDRESPHVVNGTYTILLNAVDNGKTVLLLAWTHTKYN